MNLPVTGTAASEVGIPKMLMTSDVVSRSPISELNTVQSVEQINGNISLICLVLEGVERCAEVLGTGFQTELIEVLYPLLVKVHSENARVSRCALLALRGIARSCGAPGLSELLHQNADYIVNAVSLRLRHVSRYPESPSVLGVALRHGSAELLPVFHDVILEVRLPMTVAFCLIVRPHSACKKLSGGVLAWLPLRGEVQIAYGPADALPLTVSCFSKIQIGFTFLVPAYGTWLVPDKGPLTGVVVCTHLHLHS